MAPTNFSKSVKFAKLINYWNLFETDFFYEPLTLKLRDKETPFSALIYLWNLFRQFYQLNSIFLSDTIYTMLAK